MVLEEAIGNITAILQDLCPSEGSASERISSNEEKKEVFLKCLGGLIKEAPDLKYREFITVDNFSSLVENLICVLCQLAKDDRSKSIRTQSMLVMLNLISRLEEQHQSIEPKCSIEPVVFSLPGVCSKILFKLITSDTKLPKNLIIVAMTLLSKFISISFLPCDHNQEHNLTDICDNLAIILKFLIQYISNNSNELAEEILIETLNLCGVVACQTNEILMNKVLNVIIGYVAFISSRINTPEVKLKILLINNTVGDSIKNTGDFEIMSSLIKLVDELKSHSLSLLAGERLNQLSILCGYLKLLSDSSITTLMETIEKRDQLIELFAQLCEFSTEQPFLCLTDMKVDNLALELNSEKIYTVEKRFKHIDPKELKLIKDSCSIIAHKTDWQCLNNTFMTVLNQFDNSSNLFLTHLFVSGIFARESNQSSISRFSRQMIDLHIDKTHERFAIISKSTEGEDSICPNEILKIVISIETITTLVKLYIKNTISEPERIIILKDLLCPLLNWASSSSRAISEAALSSLTQISHSFGHDSIKTLIESNIDYIVDGVMHMLDNFMNNSEVTNVLAITFKLSSMNSFYYFRDVYEKIFQLLGMFHHTEKSKTIAMLFYRTVSILSDWKSARSNHKARCEELDIKADIKSILFDIDVKRRIDKLNDDLRKFNEIKQKIDHSTVTKEDENAVMNEIKSGCISQERDKSGCNETDSGGGDQDVEVSSTKKKPNDIELTEKILSRCVTLISSNCNDTKILALRTAAQGMNVLRDDENTLLPLVHQLWSPLVQRLTSEYSSNLEINLSAYECLISMAECAKDFIKARTLDLIIPKLCLFLESQAGKSLNKNEYGPYCMTMAHKCQLKILSHLGALTYHIQLAYSSLWKVIKATIIYLHPNQVPSLRRAALISLHYMIALDPDCVWYYSKRSNVLDQLPFELIYELEDRKE